MLFAPTETQLAVRGVAADAFARPDATWKSLAGAGLLALAVPTDCDGEGLSLAEVGEVVRAAGAHAVSLPLVETLAFGVLTLAAAGSAAQQKRLLPDVATGAITLTAALNEPGAALPITPTTRLTQHPDGHWLINGTKTDVWAAKGAKAILVPATRPDGTTTVALLDPTSKGVTRTDSPSSVGANHSTLTLRDAELTDDDLLPDPHAHEILRRHAIAGLALLGAGVLEGARDLTSQYIKNREQFGRKLAEFQAVAQQIADVYIASRTISLAAESAAWRLTNDHAPDDDLAVAAHWFTAEGPKALHICQHLHGGMGVDITYPLHAYYELGKDIAHALGGTQQSLAAVPTADETDKNAELSDAQRQFKAETRAYFEQLMTRDEQVDIMANRHGGTYHRIVKQMGSDGWMGVGWPVEYGGRNLGEIEQQIFANEAARSDIPLPSVTLQTVGPTLQSYGTQKQKDMFLADILSGDVHFAIGYSEPDAGTDLASLRTSARRDGDHYIVNGQKMWTTGGHAADYLWLATRTDPDAPKHKGISVLIVDTKDPGFSWTPIITIDGSHHTNATYFQDVRVPVDMLVGEENRGWQLITTQLNHERVMLAPAGRIEGLRDAVRDWATTRTTPDGQRVLDQPDVHDALARATAAFRVNELLNWNVATSGADGNPLVADASASKVFAADQLQVIGRELEAVVHRYGDPTDPDTAFLMQYLDYSAKRFLVLTFGGGVQEIQRELIAMFGLGLPKVPR